MEYAACAWRAGRGVCRCCLSEGCYKDIATEYYWMGERELYQDMLRECFDLTISYQDGGTNSNSRLICEVCITRLRDASNFKKQVINAEKRFAEHILTGSKLSDITEAAPAATFQEVKLEGVKDETGISDDDDMGADEAATDDPDYDPDYDESDMLPLKFEVQKKEALVEFSFGDEMPTLNTNETTIRRVSKSKGKSPSKKIKMSKKELTIKPIKASGSKVAKVPKAPKPAKVPVKKGRAKQKSSKLEALESHGKQSHYVSKDSAHISQPKLVLKRVDVKDNSKTTTKKAKAKPGPVKSRPLKIDSRIMVEFSNMIPFKWSRNMFWCFCCSTSFYEMKPLREHTVCEHSAEDIKRKIWNAPKSFNIKVDISKLKCKLCSTPLHDLNALKSHLTSEHDTSFADQENKKLISFKLMDGTFECQFCTVKCVTFNHLTSHVNKHFSSIICDICGVGLPSMKMYNAHKQKHRSAKIECDICKLKFRTMYLKNSHIVRKHKKILTYTCPHCSKRFKEYRNRYKHMVSVHGMTPIVHKCNSCDKIYADSHCLKTHIRSVHLNERNHECDVCGLGFFQKYLLRRHMTSAHGTPAKTVTLIK